MDGQEGNNLPQSPELKAGWLSQLFLWWLVPFLRKGAKKDLNLEDVYHSLPEHSSEKLGSQVEKKWNQELHSAGLEGRPPKIWRVIARLIWRRYLLMGLGHGFDELVLRTLQPLAFRSFIRTFSVENPAEDQRDLLRDQVIYASLLVFLTFCHTILRQNLIGFMDNVGIELRVGISSLVYRKVLRLQKSDTEQANIGKLSNLLSNDVPRIDENFHLFNFFYIAPIQLSIYTYLLWSELGVACLGGVGAILIILPLLTYINRFSMFFRFQISNRTDDRARFLSEIIGGIRLVKMYAWEVPFAEKIAKLRELEIDVIRKSHYFKGMHVSAHTIATKFIPFCAFILYVSMGNSLTAEKAFFSISVFNMINQAILSRISIAVSQMGNLIASCNRVEEFMLSKEISESRQKNQSFNDIIGINDDDKQMEPKISIKNYTASWTDERSTLKKINVDLNGNKLIMVVGCVGSGKSTFLNAVLSELPITSGDCHVQGQISYSSQEAWIFHASIRQNILFGLDMDEDRYWTVVKLCCLSDDLVQFPYGDLTLVGERGITLSGGQKARVNLARALFQKADIYLMDDPLSAVDGKVGKLLFSDCIQENLKGKLRILVTHQLQYLPMADHIIVLNREGEIWDQGTYEQLQNSGIDFTSLISEEYMNSNQVGKVESQKKISKKDSETVEEKAEPFGLRRRGVHNKEDKNEIRSSNEPKKVGMGESSKPEVKEEKSSGSLGMSIYFRYFKAGGSTITVLLLAVAYIMTQLGINVTDYWLSKWTNVVTSQEGQTNQKNHFAYVYSVLMILFIFASLFRSWIFFRYCMKISINLHDGMFKSLVRAPVKFFDDNPSGRIMNRFTKDMNQIDEKLPVAFYDFCSILLVLLGALALNILANHYVGFPAVIMLASLWKLRGFFLKTAIELKRIESVAKSPMLTHVTMTVQGLTTIRALKAQKRVMDQFETIQDNYTAVYYMISTTNRWFIISLELLTVTFLAAVCSGFLIFTTSAQGGNVGVAISAVLSLAGGLQWGMRKSADTENCMTSVERILEYSNLKAEAPLKSPEDADLPLNWPKGHIEFHDVSLAYDEERKNKVLKKVTFSVEPQEKIGIAGRTGVGKSSLITAIFRLTEPCNGRMTIDGVAIEKLGLHALRSRISIICQDPLLFAGTLRYNLDPFGEYNDDHLWNVLKEVDLLRAIQTLDCPVADGGSNFSVGQKQLVCLARAILRKNKILVLDEATANVDPVTDQLVQHAIKTKFSDCTILTIAHRLETILDNDKIMVLDGGKIVDFDSPDVLIKHEDGERFLRQAPSSIK